MLAAAGDLRHPFVIERAVETQGATGEPLRTWVNMTAVLTGGPKCYGSLTPTTGTEFKRAGQITGSMSHQVRFWYFDGLLVTDRLTLTDTRKKKAKRVFNIVSIENVGELDEELSVIVKEAV